MITSGSLVELINDKWLPSKYNEVFPVKGVIYTVRAVHVTDNGIGIHLEEIVNKEQRYKGGICEILFNIRRFREVASNQSAILATQSKKSIFHI